MSARKQAREMQERAQRDLTNARRRHRRAARGLEDRADERAELVAECVRAELERFRVLFIPFVDVEYGGRSATEGPVIGAVEDPESRDHGHHAVDGAKSAGFGVLGGAGAAGGTYFVMGSVGVASTGTPIATLSGAAAHNAIMAALGGGSLATGGGGMYAGAMTLGGIAAAPVFVVGGLVYWHLGRKALAQAQSNVLELEVTVAKLDADRARIDRVGKLVERLIVAAELLTEELAGRVEDIATWHVSSLDECTTVQHSYLARTAALAETLHVVATVPAWSEMGNPTARAYAAIKKADALLRDDEEV